MTRPLALCVEGAGFAYGNRVALKNVDLAIAPGGFTALLGPNGAGKTTLMALITGLFHTSTGRILVAGHDIAVIPRRALEAIGVVFQRPTLDLDLSVRQNLGYAASLRGIGGKEAKRRIETLLERFGLADRGREPARALSGGLQRRLEIARAFLHEPTLLVLDEPTVGLDVEGRQTLVETAHGLCRETETAVLWATHLIDEVRPGDRVAVLVAGEVRAQGSLDDVLRAADAPNLEAAWLRLTRKRDA